MGGFAFSYIAGTEVDLATLPSSGGRPQFDFYRIDDTHLLCLCWRTHSTDTWLFVVDHSDPVTVTFGTPVNVTDEGITDLRPTLTQLTSDGDWLLCYTTSDYQRLTVSGNTVTVGEYLVGFSPFSYGTWAGTIPDALWEGHDASSPSIQLTPEGAGHVERLGIDYDHILVPGSLSWFDGIGYDEPKWYVLDLTTADVQPVAVFDTSSGYYPNGIGAAQLGPGIGYWWTWDSWPAGDFPSGLELILVETDGSSITMTQVTGYSFDSVLAWPVDKGTLDLADDGKWWLGATVNTRLETFWTDAAPWVWQTTMVMVDGTSAATLDYIGEADFRANLLQRVWPFDAGRICDETGRLSWKITDEHLRVENHSHYGYGTDSPHYDGGSARLAGLSHNRVVIAYATAYSGTPGQMWGAVYQEIGLPPSPDFNASPSTVDVGTPVSFDAEDYVDGHDTKEQTRDSYWHPVLEYRWEWDDGTPDVYTTSPTTTHTYTRGSTTHITGADTADADINDGLIGETGYYLPLLRARNSVGWSYANGGWWIEVLGPDIPPPQRQFPRDDGLGISTRRSWPPPTSKQYGQRRGPAATYL